MEVNYQLESNPPFEPASTSRPGNPPPSEIPDVGSESGVIACAEDYAECRRIMRQASKNYSFASNFLPEDRLRHVEALYALMRVGDDRVDVSHTGFASPQEAIADWEKEYWLAFERMGSPHPVLRAYLDTSLKFGIPADAMADYFQAMQADLTITRFNTFVDLMHYMDGSAIPVGRAMTHILGVCQPYTVSQAVTSADSLSIAMQLSNFWRDIGEDWRRGRIYLPLEDMEFFRYSEADLGAGRINGNFIDMLEFQFERTETYYRSARRGVGMLASGQVAVMSALEIYRAILFDIRSNAYDVFTRRAGTTRLRKLSLIARAYWRLHRI
jgi:phytoene synthase